MKKIVILTFICITLSHFLLMGQCTSNQERPAWVDGIHYDLNNSTVKKFIGSDYTKDAARNKAVQRIIEDQSIATGVSSKITETNGVIRVTLNDQLIVKARILDEYHEYCINGQYEVNILAQITKHPNYDFDKVDVTTEYKVSARVLVPGMAQIYKGTTGKGIAIIASEVVMVGGIVISESLRASFESKVNSTYNTTLRQNYINNANTMKHLRTGFIVGAAAVYAWNIIDGIVAKGKKHVFIENAQIIPYVSPYENGLAVRIKF